MSFWLRNFFLSLETTTGRQGSLGVPSKWIFFLESLGLSALGFYYGDFESCWPPCLSDWVHCGLYHHPQVLGLHQWGAWRLFLRREGAETRRSTFPLSVCSCYGSFSRILAKASNNGRFSHHPRCSKLDLTHRCFADDLLLFCQVDFQSASVIKESLDSFSGVDGKSWQKANFSVLGWMKMLSTMLKTFLASKRKGPCPSSILECPLFPLDSQPEIVGLSLIRFPKKRVESWTSKRLSDAGRLPLIRSVLFSIQGYCLLE